MIPWQKSVAWVGNVLYRMKSGTEELNYGREIIRSWAVEGITGARDRAVSVLDIGLGEGKDLRNIQETLGREARYCGIESYPPSVERAKKSGIDVADIDIESTRFPYEDQSFDVVVANQVLEHTKELFWIFSEVARILKPGGVFIVGVPNLASLHNRTALLFGLQPPAIKTLGPHVRGFTKKAMQEFAETNGYFVLKDYKGSNFYPFPPALSKKLSRLLPQLAVGSFYRFERTEKGGCFLEILDQQFFETPYFRGVQKKQEGEK